MFTIKRTDAFDNWLTNLKNPIAKKAVITRLMRLEMGHFGDIDNVGEGVFELRIHVNTGIRVYAIQRGDDLILLLAGGDKSTQTKDIAKAKLLAQQWEDEDDENQEI